MTLLLLIRHGENEYATTGRLAGRLPGVHLNLHGQAQARALGEALRNAPLTAVYASPLERALETAQPIAAQLAAFAKASGERLDADRAESASGGKQLREEVVATMGELANLQKVQLEAMSSAIGKLSELNEKKLESVRATVEDKLQSIQMDNARQLDQMRQTVDEILHGTLEKRLGESFKLISERLELVHKGLGEMQTLATGVGDLKKVLTNVKTRGTWGEVQLGTMLEQVLNPDQFAANVATTWVSYFPSAGALHESANALREYLGVIYFRIAS